MILILISSLSVCILIFLGILLLWSPGKPRPIVDEVGRRYSQE